MVISRKSLAIFGLALSASLFTAGCDSKKVNSSTPSSDNTATGDGTKPAGNSDDGTGETTPGSTLPPGKVEALAAGYGILNFRQAAATLSSLTGVALNAPAAAGGLAPAGEYIKALSALPTDHAPAAITAGKVASLTKLASSYCDVMANNAALLTAKFPGLTVTAVPADAAAYAKTLVDGFYGTETALQGPRAADIQLVAATVNALKALPNATGPAVFMATCAGIASSGEFFLY